VAFLEFLTVLVHFFFAVRYTLLPVKKVKFRYTYQVLVRPHALS